MLRAETYYFVYILSVSILTIIICLFYDELKKSKYFSAIICLIATLFIGLRPISGVFVDMGNYHSNFLFFKELNPSFVLDTHNVIFTNLFIAFMVFDWPEEFFYLIIASIYFGCMLWACYKIFPDNVLVSFLVCLAALSTFSYGTNGIKAGAAASIFLVALAYRDRKWLALIIAIISWMFHHSMTLVIGSLIITYIIENSKFYFRFWLFSLIMAILHITVFQNIFGQLTDEQGAGYLIVDSDSERAYLTGFRADFIIYSCIPILINKILRLKYIVVSKQYDNLINIYTFTNAIWMLCMYASFTNRIAYLSWFMYPIVLVYPFFKLQGIQSQRFYTIIVITAHLAFTLFMHFVYL